MAVKKSPKIEAQVVEAIRRLQTIQGSTPREISNYIAQEYNVPGNEIRRHVQLALKRGVTYGILRRIKGGCYLYNQDFLNGPGRGDNPVSIRCKRRSRRRGRSRRRSSRRRSSRRRRSGRRRRSRRRRSRRRTRRRRREEVPGDVDGGVDVTKQPSKSGDLLRKDSPRSNRSTVTENSEGQLQQ